MYPSIMSMISAPSSTINENKKLHIMFPLDLANICKHDQIATAIPNITKQYYDHAHLPQYHSPMLSPMIIPTRSH